MYEQHAARVEGIVAPMLPERLLGPQLAAASEIPAPEDDVAPAILLSGFDSDAGQRRAALEELHVPGMEVSPGGRRPADLSPGRGVPQHGLPQARRCRDELPVARDGQIADRARNAREVKGPLA